MGQMRGSFRPALLLAGLVAALTTLAGTAHPEATRAGRTAAPEPSTRITASPGPTSRSARRAAGVDRDQEVHAALKIKVESTTPPPPVEAAAAPGDKHGDARGDRKGDIQSPYPTRIRRCGSKQAESNRS